MCTKPWSAQDRGFHKKKKIKALGALLVPGFPLARCAGEVWLGIIDFRREEQGLCTEPGFTPAAPHLGHRAAGKATKGKEKLPFWALQQLLWFYRRRENRE